MNNIFAVGWLGFFLSMLSSSCRRLWWVNSFHSPSPKDLLLWNKCLTYLLMQKCVFRCKKLSQWGKCKKQDCAKNWTQSCGMVWHATAKVHYGTSLSNVDWLHGGAESLLTVTNLFIVIGLRKAIREAVEDEEKVIAEEEKDVPLLKWNAGDCLII